MISSISRTLVFAIPLLALFMKGGVSVEAQMSLAVPVALTVVLAALYGRPIGAVKWVINATALVVGFLSFYIMLQAYLPALTSHAADIWAAAGEVSGQRVSFVSLAPADTIASVVAVTNPFLLFCSGLLLCRDDQSARWMLDRLARAGGLLVFGTLVLFLIEPNALLIWDREHYVGSFTLSFVNRNTAATFIGLVGLLLVAQIIRRTDRQAMSDLQRWLSGEKLVAATRRAIAVNVLDIFLCMACALALVLTLSRAGIASSLLAIVCLLSFSPWLWSRRRRASRKSFGREGLRWLIAPFGIVLLLFFAFLLTGHAQARLAAGFTSDARFCIYPAVIEAIRDNWLWGAGFGTFEQSFAPYQPASCGLDGIWERAHNFYLEGMLGLGLVFLPLLCAAIYILARAFWLGLRQRQRERIYPAAGISAMVLVLSHSLVDFSLQIPGVSLYFAAIMAPLVVLSLGRNEHQTKRRHQVAE